MQKDVEELVHSMMEYIDNVLSYIPAIVEDYRRGKVDVASSTMIELSEGLLWLDDAMKVLDEKKQIDREVLKKVYHDILQALDNLDYFLVADILEYDLLAKMEKIKENLGKIVK